MEALSKSPGIATMAFVGGVVKASPVGAATLEAAIVPKPETKETIPTIRRNVILVWTFMRYLFGHN